MDTNICSFVTDARFFEAFSAAHRPTLVQGRNFYSLTYRLKGRALIHCNGTTLESHADCVTFMPKDLAYTTEILEDVHMIAIHFDLMPHETGHLPAVLPVGSPTLRALFQALIKKGDDERADYSRMAIFYNILDELKRMRSAANQGTIPQKIVTARALIEENYADAQFSIDALAEKIGVSTSYLRREFLAAYGNAPIQYLKELRIRNAKRLLIAGDASVATTATLCGYTSTSYFIQDFRRTTGESPRRYQQRILLSL